MNIVLSEFSPVAIPYQSLTKFDSVEAAENILVENGNEKTRALFNAAKLSFETLNTGIKDDETSLLLTIRRMSRSDLVIATDESDPDSLVGVGSYARTRSREPTDSTTLSYLAIDSRYQKQGHGGKILERVEERSRQQGATTLIVWSLLDAVDFYEKHGYTPMPGSVTGLHKQLH